jgi:hypothetical protein
VAALAILLPIMSKALCAALRPLIPMPKLSISYIRLD